MKKKICLCTAVMFMTTCTFAISLGSFRMPVIRSISRSAKIGGKQMRPKKIGVRSPSVTRGIMDSRRRMATSSYHRARKVYSNPPLWHRLQNQARRLVAAKQRPLSPEYVSKKARTSYSVAEYAQIPVDGYMDHPWKTLAGKEQFLNDMESALAEVYPAQEGRYYGVCAASLNGIQYMLSKGFRAEQTLSEAMETAYRSTMSTKSTEASGFFVIGVATHERGPMREALLLDVKNQQWISFNKSKAKGWQEAVRNAPISENGAYIVHDRLNNTSSAATRTWGESLAEKVLSNDGVTGVVLTPKDQIYVRMAMEKGYYIYLEPIGDVYTLPVDVSQELGGMTGLYDEYQLSFAVAKGETLYPPKILFGDIPEGK